MPRGLIFTRTETHMDEHNVVQQSSRFFLCISAPILAKYLTKDHSQGPKLHKAKAPFMFKRQLTPQYLQHEFTDNLLAHMADSIIFPWLCYRTIQLDFFIIIIFNNYEKSPPPISLGELLFCFWTVSQFIILKYSTIFLFIKTSREEVTFKHLSKTI